MITPSSGRDLFIADNSVSGWAGLRYLEEWTSIAKAFDIATGYFEIGALLALDGKWQQLDKIRILMGAETTCRSRKTLLDAVRSRAMAPPYASSPGTSSTTIGSCSRINSSPPSPRTNGSNATKPPAPSPGGWAPADRFDHPRHRRVARHRPAAGEAAGTGREADPEDVVMARALV